MAYAGRATLFEKQLSKLNVHMVGFQETHSEEGGIAKQGQYIRVVPDTTSDVNGDLELWFSATKPWDPNDPTTIIDSKLVLITHQGPKMCIANVTTSWIAFDVVVLHAPHSWTTGDDDAEAVN